ncbi:hypothetical protein CRN75_17100 [Yersinia frederiksenii]|nr:hypothetical protein CRN75_17100 [Yersinia frederiksenii]
MRIKLPLWQVIFHGVALIINAVSGMSRLKRRYGGNLREASQISVLYFAINMKFITMLIAYDSVMFFIKMSQN